MKIASVVRLKENEDLWEEVVDFTKLKKGGIEASELLSRLKKYNNIDRKQKR